jgi:hypothetical protein
VRVWLDSKRSINWEPFACDAIGRIHEGANLPWLVTRGSKRRRLELTNAFVQIRRGHVERREPLVLPRNLRPEFVP